METAFGCGDKVNYKMEILLCYAVIQVRFYFLFTARERPVTPVSCRRKEEAQIKETRTTSEFIFHGCKVPW
jgi:hypothetical protein